ncbi:hypothetical protein B5X24_HaOG214069 [Helicoverpa armigera]|nr:hypothetical protein B5X24_HaOG214069 [Helicoverpa armigera]
MSQTLKCNTCNIVINELLAYVQNKISVIDEDTLKRICLSSFSSSEISDAKSLLFESLPAGQRKIIRKRKGKEGRDLDDIVGVFKSTDPEVIPIFVARVLEKLPPILFDHLDCTKLLKDITKLTSDVETMKNTYATVTQVEELRADICQLKHVSLPPPNNPAAGYVNSRRGTWNMESGPIGMTPNHNYTSDEHDLHSPNNMQVNNSPASVLVVDKKRHVEMNDTSLPQVMQKDDSPLVSQPVILSQVTSCDDVAGLTKTLSSIERTSNDKQNPKNNKVELAVDQSTKRVSQTNDEKQEQNRWQTVSHRKRKPKYRYMGQKGSAEAAVSSFKAAIKKIPIFITNVHIDALESDIVDYLKMKTQENVFLEKFASYNCKNVKSAVSDIRRLCDECALIALQETWLLPDELSYLNGIDSRFSCTGTSAVDTAAGLLRDG